MVKLSCWCIKTVMMLDELVVNLRVCLFSSQDNVMCTVQISFFGCEETNVSGKRLNLLNGIHKHEYHGVLLN